MFATYSTFTRANQKVVVISPGHSIGYDSGATSQYKSEAQVNQELSGRLVRLLNQRGYKVYITHTTDAELASQKLLNQEEGSSLRNLGSAANSVDPDLVLSIHHNSGGSTASGYELYWSSYRSFDTEGVYTVPGLWSTGSDAYRDSSPCTAAVNSLRFAKIVKSKLDGQPKIGFRKIEERDDYLPAHVTSPCILYEGGFLSNPSEAQYLASDAYQNEAASRLAAAIDEFFGTPNEVGSAVTPADTQVPTITSVSASATVTGDTKFTIFATATDNVGVSAVKFATWTDRNGQDDIVWLNGTNNGNNNWSAVIDTSQHNNESGVYHTHVYAYDKAGNFVGVAAPSVTVTPAQSSAAPGLTVTTLNSNTAVAYANGLGATSYRFAVWSEDNGQDDLIWTDGTPQVNGSSECVINRSDHNNDQGKYFVHCYTSDLQFVGGNEIDFGRVTTTGFAASVNNGTITVNVSGLKSPFGLQRLLLAVWSEENGQDDLVWYEPSGSNGNYTLNVNTANHSGNGTYWIHGYIDDSYGLKQFVGAAAAQVGGNSQQAANTTTSYNPVASLSQSGEQVLVTVTGVPAGYDVFAATWSEVNGQDDLIWHPGILSGSSFVATINVREHPGDGTHIVHVYTRDASGAMNFVSAHSYIVQTQSQPVSSAVTLDTPIMGNSGTTTAQLVNFYNNHTSIAFPDYYVVRGVSLAQFAQMYIEECQAENVRADLAFAQAMHETGFLRFGGDVSISQFNFAGLGATGNGVPGENFAAQYGDNANGIRMGIRAQVQHLKAYGSTDPLNQACVDSRFGYVSRGCSPTIGGLGGKWAVDKVYSERLVNYINQI